jgi:ribonucleotide reductase alpha subunit
MLDVIRLHRSHVAQIDARCPKTLRDESQQCWNRALAMGEKHGYRNAQVTLLAAPGMIAFLMDCDTPLLEPDIALVKYKLLAGGGILKIVNCTVPMALEALGYNKKQVKAIVEYIDQNDTIEGAPHLKAKHLSVFDCAFKAQKGTRSLHYMALLRMMAATQPFISGAITKTINMPESATVEEIMTTYIEGWKLGLKAVAIYRDGSKRSAAPPVRGHIGQSLSEKTAMLLVTCSCGHKFNMNPGESKVCPGCGELSSPTPTRWIKCIECNCRFEVPCGVVKTVCRDCGRVINFEDYRHCGHVIIHEE